MDITQENYRAVLAHQGDAVVDDERDILKLRAKLLLISEIRPYQPYILLPQTAAQRQLIPAAGTTNYTNVTN